MSISNGMKTINWYNEVSRSLDKIPDCINHYEEEYKKAKDKMYNNGALYASMTGSGSAVYGIFEKSM